MANTANISSRRGSVTPATTTAEPAVLPLGESAALGAAADIFQAARENGAEVRALGGIAVALRCPSARSPGALARTYSDVDLVTNRASVAALETALERLGYEPQERFNALHGHARKLFDRRDGVHVDVFVDEFAMCHRLQLAPRLTIHETTVSLADLFLTKLQVAQLNEKDVTDATALLVDHDLMPDETGINRDYVVALLARDWGWWRTVTPNLAAVLSRMDNRLTPAESSRVERRVTSLLDAIDKAAKSFRWRARAKAGDRIPWRDDPEETA
jgi:putative nucleotidyltransferase-like protein